MFRIERAWWLIAFILLATLSPGQADAARLRDPYAITTLSGTILFEYERFTSSVNEVETTKTNSFRQGYELDLRGNVISRGLMIYDAGVGWERTDYTTRTTETDTTIFELDLSTTLLPLSRIPLTMYYRRTQDDITGGVSRDTTRSTYGFVWNMEFRVLPETRLQAERQTVKGSTDDLEKFFFNANFRKILGPTDNTFDYRFTTSENKRTTETNLSEVNQHVFNFRNQTDISRHTRFTLGAVRGTSSRPKSAVPTDATHQAISASLESKPGPEFEHTHHYTYYSVDAENEHNSSGETYDGEMTYEPTDRLKTQATLLVENLKNDIPPMNYETDTLEATGRLDYILTDRLTVDGIFRYLEFESNSTLQTGTLSTNDVFRLAGGITYGNVYDWGSVNARYGAGFRKEGFEGEGSGSGIEQEVSMAASSVDINPLFIFSASASYFYFEGLEGPVWERDSLAKIDFENKPLKEYVEMSAGYDRRSTSSWIDLRSRTTELYYASAISEYLDNTRLELRAEHRVNSDEEIGTTTTDTMRAGVLHERVLLGGLAKFSARYTLTDSDFSTGQTEKTTTRDYLVEYRRMVLPGLLWNLSVQRLEEEITGTSEGFTNENIIENALQYRLRAWLLTFEDTLVFRDDETTERTDHTVFLRATRSFTRFF